MDQEAFLRYHTYLNSQGCDFNYAMDFVYCNSYTTLAVSKVLAYLKMLSPCRKSKEGQTEIQVTKTREEGRRSEENQTVIMTLASQGTCLSLVWVAYKTTGVVGTMG